MLIQKIKVIVPDEVDEVVYTEKEQEFIKFNNDDLDRLKRKIVIYKTFDLHCRENNFFNLYLSHILYDWKTFHYLFNVPFENYISKLEYEFTFNKLEQEFEFTINGVCGKKL
jgi:hypothetical protein